MNIGKLNIGLRGRMRYYLFAGNTYYAAGGARDFIKVSDNLESLCQHARDLLLSSPDDPWADYEWYHIADENMRIVAKSDQQAHS